MNAQDKVKIAAEGLNQAYIEHLLPSRVARLWATVEHVLDSKSPPLFTRTERRALIKKIKKLGNLNDEKVEKINYTISNLHIESRNERIAKNISILMDVAFEVAYDKVRNASVARGKNVHEIRDNWEVLKECEKFLQEVLSTYIAKNLKKGSTKRFSYGKKRLDKV